MTLVLAYDLGTTACKAIIWRPSGEPLAEASYEYPTSFPQPTWAEQDPEDWWRALVGATERLGRPDLLRQVDAIGFSSQREGVVPIDGAGQKLADCIIWMDRGSQPQAAEIDRVFGREQVHARTGPPPDPTFTATKWGRNRCAGTRAPAASCSG